VPDISRFPELKRHVILPEKWPAIPMDEEGEGGTDNMIDIELEPKP
jgi:hypothetical protein